MIPATWHDPMRHDPAPTGKTKRAPDVAALWPAIVAQIDRDQESVRAFRRAMHANPEPSGEERRTAETIADALREFGLEPRELEDCHGIIADIDLGASPDSFIALRADIDCVRVHDEKDAPYRSTREECCHACGHDAHTSILLGVARALVDLPKRMAGADVHHNIRLIFQPAEEIAQGAQRMIDAGALKHVRAIFALHVEPTLPAGVIGFRQGPLTAGSKRFDLAVQGSGGHSARPHEAHDPIAAAAGIMDEWYRFVPRSVDPREAVVLTVCTINAGSIFNVIPRTATCTGSLRATRDESFHAAEARMEAIVEGIAISSGCSIDLTFHDHCPPTDNDSALTCLFEQAAVDVLGSDSVLHLEHPSMGAEDFAFFQRHVPGSMARIGVANPDRVPGEPLHSGRFDIDERALLTGVSVMARTAIQAAMELPPSDNR